jgi:hypothetical protein
MIVNEKIEKLVFGDLYYGDVFRFKEEDEGRIYMKGFDIHRNKFVVINIVTGDIYDDFSDNARVIKVEGEFQVR